MYGFVGNDGVNWADILGLSEFDDSDYLDDLRKNIGHTENLVGRGIVGIDVEVACDPVGDGLKVGKAAVAAGSRSGLLEAAVEGFHGG